MAAPVHLSQTTWPSQEGDCPRVAGSGLSGEGHDSGNEGLGLMDAVLVAVVVGVAAALQLAACGYWLEEVKEGALLHPEGIGVVQVGQVVKSEAVRGPYVVEIHLLVIELGQVAEAGFPGPAFSAPHWGESGPEGGVPWVHGIAAVLGKWAGGKGKLAQGTPVWVYGVQQSLAWGVHGPWRALSGRRVGWSRLLPQKAENHSYPSLPGKN